MPPKIGDTVTFHLITKHRCGGQQCQCDPDLAAPARVVHVWPQEETDPVELVLDVAFPPDSIVGVTTVIDHLGKPITTDVTVDGYTARQSRSPETQDSPPESGSWTA